MEITAQKFEQIYNRPPTAAVRAPGRVNLIGEHTDYNGGFVLPIAIERQTVVMFAARDDGKFRFTSLQAPAEAVTVGIDQAIVPMEQPKWANYPKGVLDLLRGRGVKLVAGDLLMDSDVPLGGGLSSSASLEVATLLALLSLAGASGTIPDGEMAALCQKAENHYAGAPCGIMDQSIAVMGRRSHALLLDCHTGAARQIPFDDPNLVLLVADTQVKHSIGDGGYPARRQQCNEAAAALGVGLLREATAEMIRKSAAAGKLGDLQLMRARHVIGEIGRTLEAVEALEAGDYGRFGRLMCQSHESLRDDYEVSCEELDAIVAAARGCKGVFGARMTGGGFGGCAIVLAEAGHAAAITAAIEADFSRRFGRKCPIFATHAAAGAGEY